MPKLIDLTGQQFGKITVLKRVPNKGNRVYWLCQCECGEQVEISGTDLRSGKRTWCISCGKKIKSQKISKIASKQYIDLTGQQFGYWHVLERDNNDKYKNKGAHWKCQCICGEIHTIAGSELRLKRTTSCGCITKTKFIDLTGQKIGYWTVLKRDLIHFRPVHQICQCECGTIKSIRADSLKNGESISCGCINKSHGEQKIQNILEKNNIIFEQQKSFNDCLNVLKNTKLKFDFYLSEYNTLIEYDGSQHTIPVNYWNGKQKLQQQQLNDNIKNEWCLNNNINLIRIPYTHLKNIKLDDLLPNSSKYLNKGENN